MYNKDSRLTEIHRQQDGRQVLLIPPRPKLLVSEGESIKLDQPLTSNPNVGGFGLGDLEIVLQDPLRVQGLLFFFASVILAQVLLIRFGERLKQFLFLTGIFWKNFRVENFLRKIQKFWTDLLKLFSIGTPWKWGP
jgi:hypothetical protein